MFSYKKFLVFKMIHLYFLIFLFIGASVWYPRGKRFLFVGVPTFFLSEIKETNKYRLRLAFLAFSRRTFVVCALRRQDTKSSCSTRKS